MRNKLYYICKYTPVELLAGFGAQCEVLDVMPGSFEKADELMHPNVCGFGKSVLQAVLTGNVKELVLVNCCDSIRSVYEVLQDLDCLDYLYFMDLAHDESSCALSRMTEELKKLADSYGTYAGTAFDPQSFLNAFSERKTDAAPPDAAGAEKAGAAYLAVIGARVGQDLFSIIRKKMPLPVKNLTCVSGRSLCFAPDPSSVFPEPEDFANLLDVYTRCLMGQMPCMRMNDTTGRRQLWNDPALAGILYSTIKFCDYYGLEYAELTRQTDLPVLKLESDYTLQALGQLSTRLDAFAERLQVRHPAASAPTANRSAPAVVPEAVPPADAHNTKSGGRYFAGIDSGSASTDVVILNEKKEILATVIARTGAGAASASERALSDALRQAGLSRAQLSAIVTTGYGRNALTVGQKSITEISCHARGAFFLDPAVRTIIDIGGQDSKAIRIDETGNVINFTMNDKCAAGTGRFLEIMARTLELTPEQMSRTGLTFSENITISSMCTVFAESEIVSLIAQNKSVDDIVHGLNQSITAKVKTLADRVKPAPGYMMTGGVAKNEGVVRALEEKLHAKLAVSPCAQVCGALGAALYAMEL